MAVFVLDFVFRPHGEKVDFANRKIQDYRWIPSMACSRSRGTRPPLSSCGAPSSSSTRISGIHPPLPLRGPAPAPPPVPTAPASAISRFTRPSHVSTGTVRDAPRRMCTCTDLEMSFKTLTFYDCAVAVAVRSINLRRLIDWLIACLLYCFFNKISKYMLKMINFRMD